MGKALWKLDLYIGDKSSHIITGRMLRTGYQATVVKKVEFTYFAATLTFQDGIHGGNMKKK